MTLITSDLSVTVCLLKTVIIIIIIIECVHNYTSIYGRKQGYNWTKVTVMNMYQNQ